MAAKPQTFLDMVPLHVFRFQVDFAQDTIVKGGTPGASVSICRGAFAECTGLEASMEAKTIKEGGTNYGIPQRAGPVTFSTVVLKRGVSLNRNIWQIFSSFSGGMYAARLQVTITLSDQSGHPAIRWQLARAMPIKFKFADLNAKGTEVGIEELHLVHEGLSSVPVS